MANPDDFTGTPFVLGSIRGERCWNETGGRLFSAARKSMWFDGENVSNCNDTGLHRYTAIVAGLERNSYQNRYISAIEYHDIEGKTTRELYRKSRTNSIQMSTYLATNVSVSVVVFWRYCETVTEPFPLPDWDLGSEIMSTMQGKVMTQTVIHPEEHHDTYSLEEFDELAGVNEHYFEDCLCGFYAYTGEGGNEYLESSSILGVIEGYGETVIGTKGFRSEKARILAIAPTGNRSFSHENYVKAVIDTALLKGGGPTDIEFKNGQWTIVSGRMAGKGLLSSAAEQMKINKLKTEDPDLLQLACTYRSVKVFNSITEMREAFPLDAS